jgi:serine/threonine protein phosphatase PrpC
MLQKNSDFNSDFSGSTLVTLMVEDHRIVTCANVGDSRAIVARKCKTFFSIVNKYNWEIVRLSNDHKPHILSEKQRIHSQGGRVETAYD